LASLNLQDLRDEVQSLTEKGLSADTRLKLDLEGRNPDDGVTGIAYNKGYLFLRSIEEQYGREKFDAFLKDYFADNAFGSIDTQGFRDYISDYYQSKFGITLDDKMFDDWINTEGLPAGIPEPNSVRFQHVDQVLATWKAGGSLDKQASEAWSTHE